MDDCLRAIHKRRAIRTFEPVEIPEQTRKKILEAAISAPSGFNMQPYRLYWVESPEKRKLAAEYCLSQSAAVTASALVVAVADLNSWRKTCAGQVQWMKETGCSAEKVAEQERKNKFGRWFFLQGWFNIFGAIKWMALRMVNAWKVMGMVPASRRAMFQWATKGTALACANLMIAAEALGLNTCPMEGFDGRRLGKLLALSSRHHDIIMVIAVGKKSADCKTQPRWRRPLEETVTVL